MPKKLLFFFCSISVAIFFITPQALSWEITNLTPMSFGAIAPGPGVSILEVDAHLGPAQATLVSGTLIFVSNGGNGMMRINGNATEAGTSVSLGFPQSVKLVRVDSVQTPLTVMRLDGFTTRTPSIVTLIDGDLDIPLGARLEVKGGQISGSYVGDLPITLIFN